MKDALELEKQVFQSLLGLHKKAEDAKDPQVQSSRGLLFFIHPSHPFNHFFPLLSIFLPVFLSPSPAFPRSFHPSQTHNNSSR